MHTDNKGKHLILVTNHFPYGLGEAFLESEMHYLTGVFDKVIVLARDVHSSGQRKIASTFIHHRINPTSSFSEKLLTLWLYLRHASKIFRYLREESNHLKQQRKKITTKIFRVMIHDLTKAMITAWHIEKYIKVHQLRGEVTLYSYWLTSSALALTFVKADDVTLRRISRAHGGDIHEFRSALNYLSFRYTLAQHLDQIYSISESGRLHLLKSLTTEMQRKISVSRLGTASSGNSPDKKAKDFVIVSCAFMQPVKRIDLLIEALSLLTNVDVHWIHIGSGPLEESLHALAKNKLTSKNNVTYTFKGNLDHDDLMAFYQLQYVDCFVNTSSSEGIPVTIMEAQSFGIPVLAPNVGGISEIVNPTCGTLFPADITAEHLSTLLTELLLQSSDRSQSMRRNALENWRSKFNADRNFSTFVAEIFKR